MYIIYTTSRCKELTGVYKIEAEVLENLPIPLGELYHRVDENGLFRVRVGQQVRVSARLPVEQLNISAQCTERH